MYGLVLSHFVVDEIWHAGSSAPIEVLGGAGVHAALGQALAYGADGVSVPVSGVGADFPNSSRTDLRNAGIEDAGLVAVHQTTPRTIIRYASDHDRSERPAFGRAHFERCDPQLSMLPAGRNRPRAIYVFAGVSEPAWSVVGAVQSSPTVLWELDIAVCHPSFSEAIRQRSTGVSVVSLNEQELHKLVGGSSGAHLRTAVDQLFPSVSAVALRRGEQGAVLVTPNGVWSSHPDSGRPVVDPTGAGNAFSGALSVSWARTDGDPGQSLRIAMAAASVTVAHRGPVLPLNRIAREDFRHQLHEQRIRPLTWKELESE